MPKYELILTLRAIKEIQKAVDYYNEQQVGLGKTLLYRLKTTVFFNKTKSICPCCSV